MQFWTLRKRAVLILTVQSKTHLMTQIKLQPLHLHPQGHTSQYQVQYQKCDETLRRSANLENYPSESSEHRFDKDNKDEPDANDTPMLSALEDSSSNHSGDPDPYTAEIPDPVLDESLVTKDGTPRHVAVKQSKAELEFHKDFADKDIRTSSPVVLPTDVQTDSQVARLTRENVKRNENLYWSTQKHDFTDSFILEDDQSKSENISPKRVSKKPSPHHENIFAGFAPAMPDKLTDTREIPIQVNLSMQDFRDGYEQGLLGDLEGPALEEDEFDPYGLEPYQGGNGLYFDHSLSTIEEVSVISESTKADEDLQKDNSDSLQVGLNLTHVTLRLTLINFYSQCNFKQVILNKNNSTKIIVHWEIP